MDDDERAVQLYMLEYQKAAERYDNIYRSIWTIFSYMTAVAGGFLAFGAERIEPHALICIASIPLLFWLVTTYLPLDRYGTQVIKRLGQIECILSRDYHVDLDHFKQYANKELSVRKGLWRALKAKNWQCVGDQVRRARFAIGLSRALIPYHHRKKHAHSATVEIRDHLPHARDATGHVAQQVVLIAVVDAHVWIRLPNQHAVNASVAAL